MCMFEVGQDGYVLVVVVVEQYDVCVVWVCLELFGQYGGGVVVVVVIDEYDFI